MTATASDLDPTGSWNEPADILTAATGAHQARNRADLELLFACAAWAITHPVLPGDDWSNEPGLGGEGCPDMDRRVISELACRCHFTTDTCAGWISDALELRYRLPLVWQRVRSEQLPVWQARQIAQQTCSLTRDAAHFVDRHLTAVAGYVGLGQLRRTVALAKTKYLPDQAEQDAATAAEHRYVNIDYDLAGTDHGLASLTGTLDHLDGLDLDHALQAGAAALKAGGSTDSLDARRSIALGDLARGQTSLNLGTPDTHDTDTETTDITETSDRADGGGAQAGAGHPTTGFHANGDATGNADGDAGSGADSQSSARSEASAADTVNGTGTTGSRGVWPAAFGGATATPATPAMMGPAWQPSMPQPGVRSVGPGRELVVYVMIDAATGAGLAGTQRIPICAEDLRRWCGAPATTKITIKPVIDLNQPQHTAGYRIPARIVEHIALRMPQCVFPFCHRAAHPIPSRTRADGSRDHGCDLDHIVAYEHDHPDRAGRPGRTHTDNLAPLCREHHRLKTFTRWRYSMLRPGVYLWVDAAGHTYLRTRHATLDLGPHGTIPAPACPTARPESDNTAVPTAAAFTGPEPDPRDHEEPHPDRPDPVGLTLWDNDPDGPDTDGPDTDGPDTDEPDTDEPDAGGPGLEKLRADRPRANEPGPVRSDVGSPSG